MPRPLKQGMDWFPYELGLLGDRKLRKIKQRYGTGTGVTIYLALLEMIYGDKGYYIDYSDNVRDDVVWEIQEFLRGKFMPDAETVSCVIEDLVDGELFSADHLQKFKILTSKRIQTNFYRATVERKTVSINFDYWMLSKEEMTAMGEKSEILRNFLNRTNNRDNRSNNSDDQPKNPPNNSSVEDIIVDQSINQESDGLIDENQYFLECVLEKIRYLEEKEMGHCESITTKMRAILSTLPTYITLNGAKVAKQKYLQVMLNLFARPTASVLMNLQEVFSKIDDAAHKITNRTAYTLTVLWNAGVNPIY